MGNYNARLSRLERAAGAMAEGPETMVELEYTEELGAAIREAESALGAPLSSLTKADKAEALWEAMGVGEIGILGQVRSPWAILATALAQSVSRPHLGPKAL